jgi:hypothetical protein
MILNRVGESQDSLAETTAAHHQRIEIHNQTMESEASAKPGSLEGCEWIA